MRRGALWAGLLAALAVCPTRDLPAGDEKADEKKAWQAAELKKLAGRWTAVREEQAGPGKTRRRRVDLEFADGELRVSLSDEGGKPARDGSLKVTGVEPSNEREWLPLVLRLDKALAYYDLDGGRLVVVGRVWPRPWEGFVLSGEYTRPVEPK
jgi:hypothetical protein